jgi:hypothetical protein
VASFGRTDQGLVNFKVVKVLVNQLVCKPVHVLTTLFTGRSTTLKTTWPTIFVAISVACDAGLITAALPAS